MPNILAWGRTLDNVRGRKSFVNSSEDVGVAGGGGGWIDDFKLSQGVELGVDALRSKRGRRLSFDPLHMISSENECCKLFDWFTCRKNCFYLL